VKEVFEAAAILGRNNISKRPRSRTISSNDIKNKTSVIG